MIFFPRAVTSEKWVERVNKKMREGERKRAAEWVCDTEPVYFGWLERASHAL